MLYYRIGDTCLYYRGEFPLTPEGLMERFRAGTKGRGGPDILSYQVELRPLDDFVRATVLHYNGLSWLMELDGERYLMFPWAWLRFGYALPLASLREGDTVRCLMDPRVGEQNPPLTTDRFFSTVGLHSKFLQRAAPVLHAAYVRFHDKAILFTAPSGTGKSTQADLWVRHAGAELVNGDRVLLRKWEGKWFAYGYPCAGSSDVCLDRTLPVAAIVVLAQGPENRVEDLRPGRRVRALFAGTEHYLWDEGETELALSLAEKIAGEVPVLGLTCRPDEEAVEVLRDYLEKEGLL